LTSFVIVCLENTLCMLSVALNLLRFVLWPRL
jgi:hypothetical protein